MIYPVITPCYDGPNTIRQQRKGKLEEMMCIRYCPSSSPYLAFTLFIYHKKQLIWLAGDRDFPALRNHLHQWTGWVLEGCRFKRSFILRGIATKTSNWPFTLFRFTLSRHGACYKLRGIRKEWVMYVGQKSKFKTLDPFIESKNISLYCTYPFAYRPAPLSRKNFSPGENFWEGVFEGAQGFTKCVF